MKEIKFRAWTYWEHATNKKYKMLYSEDITEKGKLRALDFPFEIDGEFVLNIMQYIGLKDRNGKEIYEGDIIQTKDFYECGELIFKGKKEKVENLSYYLNHCAFIDVSGEVIGNIYENPELLD